MADTNSRATVYEVVTGRILDIMANGTIPWRRPWRDLPGGSNRPVNLVSKKPYRGINVPILASMPYQTPVWLTFNQARSLKGSVRKGERSTTIVYWELRPGTKTDKLTGEEIESKYMILKYYNVFNVEQCDNIIVPDGLIQRRERSFNPIPGAQAILDGYKDAPSIRFGGNRAFYAPSADIIQLPEAEAFDTEDAFYATAYHECGHSTGHSKRLNRPGVTQFDVMGSHQYSFEELVAEFTSCFLSAEAGINQQALEENAASYIAGWASKLQSEPTLVVKAASQAQKAAKLILGATE